MIFRGSNVKTWRFGAHGSVRHRDCHICKLAVRRGDPALVSESPPRLELQQARSDSPSPSHGYFTPGDSMFDIPEPSWRHVYALPNPALEIPDAPVRKAADTPERPQPRKLSGPGQARMVLNAPTRQVDHWDIAPPGRKVHV